MAHRMPLRDAQSWQEAALVFLWGQGARKERNFVSRPKHRPLEVNRDEALWKID